MTNAMPVELPKAPALLQVTPQQWQIIQSILQQYLPGDAVWAFGSRVGGPCKPYSDLDLAIVSAQPLSLQLLAQVAEAFSESDLPWKVDLIDWATTSEVFRQRVLARKLVLR
jgi:predicted nucleotidyltransferase